MLTSVRLSLTKVLIRFHCTAQLMDLNLQLLVYFYSRTCLCSLCPALKLIHCISSFPPELSDLRASYVRRMSDFHGLELLDNGGSCPSLAMNTSAACLRGGGAGFQLKETCG